MFRKIIIIVFFLFSQNVYAVGEKWSGTGGPYSTASQACAASAPATSCNNDYHYTTGVPTGNYSNMYMCTSDNIKCSTGNKSNSVDRALTTLSCPTGASAVNKVCTCPSNKPAYDSATNSCVACSAGQVLNPMTNQCQAPCNADDWSNTLMLPSGSTLTPSPYTNCVSGCEYQHKLINPGVCVFTPGPSGSYLTDEMHCVQMQSKSTGQFCSGNGGEPPVIPPPDCPSGYTLTNGACVPECPSNQEKVNGQCVPSCGPNSTREADGSCSCVEGNHMVQGQCQPDPSCENGQVLFNHQCVQPCGEGEVRSETGQCLPNCPSGYSLLNGQCIPSDCPSGQHLENGVCVDNPPNPNCGPGEVANQNGQCVPSCPAGYALVNGQCVAPTCPNGQQYSALLRKCVTSEPQCPAGTHKEGLLCVSDTPPNDVCPTGSHKVGETCVSDTPPGPGCPAGSTLVNGRCESNTPPNTSCPAGQHKNGNECVSDEPPKDGCEGGKTLEDGKCTGDPSDGEPPSKQCPEGQTVSGDTCLGTDNNGDGQPDPTTDTPTDTCPGNKIIKEGMCVDVENPIKKCSQGLVLKDGQCVSTEPPIKTCPTGQTLVGDKCILDQGPTVSCPSGQKKVGNECVLTAGPKCPDGQMLIGDKCYLVGSGGGTGEGDGDGKCDPAKEQCGEGGGGTPPGPIGTLYEKKGRSFADVLTAFSAKVQGAPIAKAGSTFFTAPSVSATCPRWTLPASDFYPSIEIDIQCFLRCKRDCELLELYFCWSVHGLHLELRYCEVIYDGCYLCIDRMACRTY